MPRIKLSPGNIFVERVDRYAGLRGDIGRPRAIQELAIIGMFLSGFINQDGTYNEDYDPNNQRPRIRIEIPAHGGKRPGAGRPPAD